MILTPCNNRLILEPCTLPELNYQIDPYIGCGHYCYYCYVLPQAVTDWRQEILFHDDITALSVLNRKDIIWQNVENILDLHFSDMKGKIEAAIFDKNNPYWENLRQYLSDIQKTGRLNLSVHI